MLTGRSTLHPLVFKKFPMKFLRHPITLSLMAAALAALTACVGGGSASPTTSATVAGVAATGLAIAGGTVTLQRAKGASTPVTTKTDGSYSVDVSKLTLPCVAQVAYTDSTGSAKKQYSLVKTADTVNITPITDMVVANHTSSGGSADAYNKFNAQEVGAYDASRIKTATIAAKNELFKMGVDVTHLPDDVIRSTLVATTTTGVTGDSQDKVLDAIKATLSAQNSSLDKMETKMHHGDEIQLSTSTGRAGDANAGKTAYLANCASCQGASISDAISAARIVSAIQSTETGMQFLAGTITHLDST